MPLFCRNLYQYVRENTCFKVSGLLCVCVPFARLPLGHERFGGRTGPWNASSVKSSVHWEEKAQFTSWSYSIRKDASVASAGEVFYGVI